MQDPATEAADITLEGMTTPRRPKVMVRPLELSGDGPGALMLCPARPPHPNTRNSLYGTPFPPQPAHRHGCARRTISHASSNQNVTFCRFGGYSGGLKCCGVCTIVRYG